MRFSFSLPLCLAAALTLAPLAAWAEGGTITVTGEATVQATPDMAVIMLGVTTEGPTAAGAMAANSAALAAVLERLRAAGVEERDLQTTNLSLNPNWVGYDGASTPRIAGYTAMNMLNVRVRDLGQLGTLLDASISDGANTLNGVTFEISAPRPLLDEARRQAVADARARAELLATALQQSLGEVVSVSETPAWGGPVPMFRADLAEAAAVPVAEGQIGISAQVTVVWSLGED